MIDGHVLASEIARAGIREMVATVRAGGSLSSPMGDPISGLHCAVVRYVNGLGPGGVPDQYADVVEAMQAVEVTYLSTVQLGWGGLIDWRTADSLVHLVRGTRCGTPGSLLCGINRFAKDGPGFSVGGGVDGPGIKQVPCPGCVEVARRDFAGLPISGLGHEAIEAALR